MHETNGKMADSLARAHSRTRTRGVLEVLGLFRARRARSFPGAFSAPRAPRAEKGKKAPCKRLAKGFHLPVICPSFAQGALDLGEPLLNLPFLHLCQVPMAYMTYGFCM